MRPTAPTRPTSLASLLLSAAAVPVVVGLMTGCDSETARADRSVRSDIATAYTQADANRVGTLQRAAGEQAASPETRALAKSAQGHAELSAAHEAFAAADAKAVEAQRYIDHIGRMTVQLQRSNLLVDALRKLDPAAAKSEIANQVATARGDGDKPWVPGDEAPLVSLATAKQKATELQGEIDKRTAEIQQLQADRQAAIDAARELTNQSATQKGSQSVETYKQASARRKEAADLQGQIDQVTATLLPLRQDLELYQGQSQIIEQAIATLEEKARQIDAGWADVQKQAQGVTDINRRLLELDAGNKTAIGAVATDAGKLAAALEEYNKLVETADGRLNNAVKLFDDATKAAEQSFREAGTKVTAEKTSQSAAVPAWKALQETVAPQQFKLAKGQAQHLLGVLWGGKATLLASREAAVAALTPVLATAGLKPPREFDAGDVATAAKEAADKANAAFASATETLTDVAGGAAPGATAKAAQASATVARMLALNAWAAFNAATGDAAAAQAHQQDARAARDEAVALNVSLPALPPSLARPPKAPTPNTPAAPGASVAPAAPAAPAARP